MARVLNNLVIFEAVFGPYSFNHFHMNFQIVIEVERYVFGVENGCFGDHLDDVLDVSRR